MRKTVAIFVLCLSAALFAGAPHAAAFGLRIGPFHIGIPFGWHHRHHLYMHANRGDVARAESGRSDTREAAPQGVISPALVYPNLALPVIFQNVFWPGATQWPFGYQNIFTTAFAKISGDATAPVSAAARRQCHRRPHQ